MEIPLGFLDISKVLIYSIHFFGWGTQEMSWFLITMYKCDLAQELLLESLNMQIV